MGLREDLIMSVGGFASDPWGHIPAARVPPGPEDLTFGNSGERLDACILYADLHRSTEMVEELVDTLAASYYKAFLHCAAKIIKRNDGTIQAYDGDRVMAVFVGDAKEERAVKTAFEIYGVVRDIVNPMFARLRPGEHRQLLHTVGIDTGTVLVAKTGVRVDSDLVWVGAAANYAAKLNSFSGLDIDYPTRITSAVYRALPEKYLVHAGGLFWGGPYNNFEKRTHYRSHGYLHVPPGTILGG